MPISSYTFDGSRIRSLDDFWDQYQSVVAGPGASDFGRNLDAFHDSLWGDPGRPETPCKFVFEHSRKMYEAMNTEQTVRELEKMRERATPENQPYFASEIDMARKGKSPTVFFWLIDELMRHDEIEVVLK
jgi:RNAse (barnase) inhibitor barstar